MSKDLFSAQILLYIIFLFFQSLLFEQLSPQNKRVEVVDI